MYRFDRRFLDHAAGCAGLKLQLVDHSVHKPSNVAVYFTVETRNGQPVANLTPQDFKIYEDKQPVSVLESKQTILNPEVAAIHYTLLLIDMSGSVVDSGEMPALIQAASHVRGPGGPVPEGGGLHVRRQPAPDAGRAVRRQRPRAACGALATRRPRDPSTNLNGAVIEGVRVLQPADGARAGAAPVRDAGGVHRRHRSRPPRQRTTTSRGRSTAPASTPTSSAPARRSTASSCRASAGRGRSRRRTRPTCSAGSTRSAPHRGGVEAVLPAFVLLAEPRGRARGRDRGERRRDQRPARATGSTPTASGRTAIPTRSRRST